MGNQLSQALHGVFPGLNTGLASVGILDKELEERLTRAHSNNKLCYYSWKPFSEVEIIPEEPVAKSTTGKCSWG